MSAHGGASDMPGFEFQTLPLRVGISTRALFDLEMEHAVFEEQGLEAYRQAQHELEETGVPRGAGFEVVSRLLAFNEPGRAPLVEVFLLSRNAPDASLRIFSAIEKHGLMIAKGSFTNGRPIAPVLKAWKIDLFLSKESADVESAIAAGIAAATLDGGARRQGHVDASGELRIALDGDSVLFGDESDRIFARDGLSAFLQHEAENAKSPMASGPFGTVFRKLAALRDASSRAGQPRRLRIALVTARTAPAHARIMHTLRAWGAQIDEAHFVGDGEKAPILAAFGAHIFFDDRKHHVTSATPFVVAGHVPSTRAVSTTR